LFVKLGAYFINFKAAPTSSSKVPASAARSLETYHLDYLTRSRRAAKKNSDKVQFKLDEQRLLKQTVTQIVQQYNSSNSSSSNNNNKQQTITDAQVNEWYNTVAADLNRSSKLKKWSESSWKFCFYTFIFVYGFYIIIVQQAPWYMDRRECWTNLLHQVVTSDVMFYYMASLGHYLHLFVSQFFDIKRKDFLGNVRSSYRNHSAHLYFIRSKLRTSRHSSAASA